MNCLNCGKPLGNRSTLCYGCESDGVDPTELMTIDDDVLDRLERYFIVSSTKCSDCGELHTSVSAGDETYTADDFGIDSIEEWELEMDKEEEWVRENQPTVEKALVHLEDEWPQSVDAVRETLL